MFLDDRLPQKVVQSLLSLPRRANRISMLMHGSMLQKKDTEKRLPCQSLGKHREVFSKDTNYQEWGSEACERVQTKRLKMAGFSHTREPNVCVCHVGLIKIRLLNLCAILEGCFPAMIYV